MKKYESPQGAEVASAIPPIGSSKSSVTWTPTSDEKLYLQLKGTKVAMFDVIEETHRIANINRISLDFVGFDGNTFEAKADTGSPFNPAAYAQIKLPSHVNPGQHKSCSIFVVNPSIDDRYAPGKLVSEYFVLQTRHLLAHEISHCIDMFGSVTLHAASQAASNPPIGLTSRDARMRWIEEFADIYAITLLKHTYGEQVARSAARMHVFMNSSPANEGFPWYEHSRFALQDEGIFQIADPSQVNNLIERYWRQ